MPMREISVNIKKAKNGFVVNCYNGKTDRTYVYSSLTDAIDELESVFSVAEDESKDSAKNDKVQD